MDLEKELEKVQKDLANMNDALTLLSDIQDAVYDDSKLECEKVNKVKQLFNDWKNEDKDVI